MLPLIVEQGKVRSHVAGLERGVRGIDVGQHGRPADEQERARDQQALENEEEFIENLANLLIDLYAVDSAQARAIQAVRRGDEKSGMHVKLAQLATWLAFSRLRSNLDQMVMSNLSENEVQEELTRLRAYIGDYLVNGVTLQRELAAVIVEKQGYPL